jgi:hypothetical protein
VVGVSGYSELISGLTAKERQEILRRLKRGPALPKAELIKYANKLRREVLAKRKQVED